MEVVFTSDAVRQFKKLPKAARPVIKEAIRIHLGEAPPMEKTRNKFPLRRVSQHADFELRVGDWRVFYRVEGQMVIVTLLGAKRGNKLIVEGEEFTL